MDIERRNLESESKSGLRNLSSGVSLISAESTVSAGSPSSFHIEVDATSVTTETAFDSNDASSKIFHCLSMVGVAGSPPSQSIFGWVYTNNVLASGSSGDSSTDIGGKRSGAHMTEIFTALLAGVMAYLI